LSITISWKFGEAVSMQQRHPVTIVDVAAHVSAGTVLALTGSDQFQRLRAGVAPSKNWATSQTCWRAAWSATATHGVVAYGLEYYGFAHPGRH
jgi:hypothetical protein